MTYRAPVSDIAFALKHAAGLKAAMAEGLYGDLDEDMVEQVASRNVIGRNARPAWIGEKPSTCWR